MLTTTASRHRFRDPPKFQGRQRLEVVRQGADLVVASCDYDWGSPAALAGQNAGKVSFLPCAEDAKAGIEGIGPYAFSASIAAPVQGATMAEWGSKRRVGKRAMCC